MRILLSSCLFLALLGSSACRRTPERSDNTAARQAGREAYKFSQQAKKAAEKAGRQLREATREAQAGWNDAKHESHDKGK